MNSATIRLHPCIAERSEAYLVMKIYEEIEHTADLGIRVYGKTLEELFSNSAWAMMDLVTDLSEVGEEKALKISIEAEDKESLMVRWLSEILYYITMEKVVLKGFDVKTIGENHIEANVKGEDFKEGKHHLTREIKAVTYHNLEIKEPSSSNKEPYWKAEIIFDV